MSDDRKAEPLLAGDVPATEGGDAPLVIDPRVSRFALSQYANLFKMSLWWTSLSPLLFALTGAESIIGVCRITYNIALCLFCPVGALFVERFSPKRILMTAAAMRFAIYVLLIPAIWALFGTSWIGAESTSAVYGALAFLLFVDGLAVAGSCVLDIDMGGLDIVSGFLGLEVTEALRNHFNAMQELIFSLCFIIFAPAMAFVGVGLKKLFHTGNASSVSEATSSSGALVGIFAIGFLLATLLQVCFLSALKTAPEAEEAAAAETTATGHVTGADGQAINAASVEPSVVGGDDQNGSGGASLCDTIGGIASDLKEGLLIIVGNQPILFRLLFFAFEIAFEDAAIVVVAAQTGIKAPFLGNSESVQGNIWTAVAVAVGKLGGAVASFLVMKKYQPPTEPRGYMVLFVSCAAATFAMVGFPLIIEAQADGRMSDLAARAVYLTLFAAYFALATLPKLGFMSLLQTMVAGVENGHRVFGFIAILATTVDAVVIMALTGLFIGTERTLVDNLWIVAYCYLGFGVLEVILGPLLILRPLQAAYEAQQQADAGEVSVVAPGLAKSLLSAEDPAPRPITTDAVADPAPQQQPQASTYTQRTSSMLVPVAPGTPRVEGGTHVMLGTSGPTPVSHSLVRRKSGFEAADAPVAADGGGGATYLGSTPRGVGSFMRSGLSAPKSPRSPRLGEAQPGFATGAGPN